jgi:hypothetical protein
MSLLINQLRSSKIQLYVLFCGLMLISPLLAACQPIETAMPIFESTSTPTQTFTPTATIEWFPATATPTLIPTSPIIPTPDYRPNLGEVILSDDFSEPGLWTLEHTPSGNVSLGLNELTIAIAEPKAYAYSIRQEPILGDFYLELTTSPMLCRGEDQYGILLRMSSPGDFYRFSLSCDGRVRLDRVVQNTASSPQPWTISSSVPPGFPITSRLAVWALGDEMRFFINDQFQFTVTDPLLKSGNLGVFARSMGETAVTVNFSDLIVRQINP